MVEGHMGRMNGVGTGNPAPWNYHYRSDPNGDYKPYDSLYTSGQIYIEPATGEPVGFFAHTPNDAWDYSGNNEIILFDLEQDGKTVRAGAHADRNGFFVLTDTDKLSARDGKIHKQAEGFIAARSPTSRSWTPPMAPSSSTPAPRTLTASR